MKTNERMVRWLLRPAAAHLGLGEAAEVVCDRAVRRRPLVVEPAAAENEGGEQESPPPVCRRQQREHVRGWEQRCGGEPPGAPPAERDRAREARRHLLRPRPRVPRVHLHEHPQGARVVARLHEALHEVVRHAVLVHVHLRETTRRDESENVASARGRLIDSSTAGRRRIRRRVRARLLLEHVADVAGAAEAVEDGAGVGGLEEELDKAWWGGRKRGRGRVMGWACLGVECRAGGTVCAVEGRGRRAEDGGEEAEEEIVVVEAWGAGAAAQLRASLWKRGGGERGPGGRCRAPLAFMPPAQLMRNVPTTRSFSSAAAISATCGGGDAGGDR